MADVQAVLERIERESVQTVDVRFTDLRGQWQHIGVAARERHARRCSSRA